MGITAEYNETAGRVVIDEHKGHPGIRGDNSGPTDKLMMRC